jgi:hypothetical protein
MFGVNRFGEDVLAPQFRQGPGSNRGTRDPIPNRDPEYEMALMSTKMAMQKNKQFQSDLRERATHVLSRNMARHPQENEIQIFIEKETERLARERVEKGIQERSVEASRSGVLRTR